MTGGNEKKSSSRGRKKKWKEKTREKNSLLYRLSRLFIAVINRAAGGNYRRSALALASHFHWHSLQSQWKSTRHRLDSSTSRPKEKVAAVHRHARLAKLGEKKTTTNQTKIKANRNKKNSVTQPTEMRSERRIYRRHRPIAHLGPFCVSFHLFSRLLSCVCVCVCVTLSLTVARQPLRPLRRSQPKRKQHSKMASVCPRAPTWQIRAATKTSARD